MKAYLYLAILLTCISWQVFAQQPAISFEKTTHDFGKVYENGGKVNYKFIFTNNGKSPLLIQHVQASCGCTTPDWTKEPINPGEQGFVMAEYDPKNRPGNFMKSLTVTSNSEPTTTTLYIKGEVTTEPIEKAENTEAAPATFVHYFNYNSRKIEPTNEDFQQFIQQLMPLVQQKDKVTITIESSASHVPTDMFKENEKLSAYRAKEARQIILTTLKKKGLNTQKVEFATDRNLVQGPEYKNDFEENSKIYEQYQYVKVTAN